jgi:hypothetical protein
MDHLRLRGKRSARPSGSADARITSACAENGLDVLRLGGVLLIRYKTRSRLDDECWLVA